MGEESLWRTLGTLYRRRRLIIVVTTLAAAASVVIALLIPNWYRARTRLLLPASTSAGIASALVGDLGSAAKSLLGTSAGDYMRYLAILNSRSVREAVVDSFDLVHVYHLEDSDTPLEDAIDTFADNTEFVVDSEYDYLSVEVIDEDPDRAAAMANFLIAKLDQINNRLSSATAAQFRRYVEQRYDEATATRGALLDSIRAFQQRYGVFDLQTQTEAFFTQIADLRVKALEAEIEYEAARNQLGPDNSQLVSLKELVDAANRQYEAALAGREKVLPVAQKRMPDVVRSYLDLEMNRTIQERILSVVAPMLEQARFEEQKKVDALQTVDPAVPPRRKDGPARSLICVAATISAFIVIAAYVLIAEWWRRRAPYFARRLRDSVVR